MSLKNENTVNTDNNYRESYRRTDLACESGIAKPDADTARDGYSYTESDKHGFRVCRLTVTGKAGEERFGKPLGSYITVIGNQITTLEADEADNLSHVCADCLKSLIEGTLKRADGEFSVLVCGLGNRKITPDAVGPLTVDKLEVTRHIRLFEREIFNLLGSQELSAIAPGVAGQTGIETAELIGGVVNHVRPDLVIAVDALASRSCERLASTIQFSDTGINPGSGIGNHRSAIDRATLGVPVIAVGVPTVVNSSTLVYDTLESAGITEIDDNLKKILDSGKSLYVSPKEIDLISERISDILAKSITEVCLT